METLLKSTFINRNKIFDSLFDDSNYYLINGNTTQTRNYSDVELNFRQNSNFFWLTGIEIPDCKCLINGAKREIVLILPDYDDNHAVWHGYIPDKNYIAKKYKFNYVINNNYLNSYKYIENDLLINLIEKFRIIKNEYEIKLMKKACKISSMAHNKIIKKVDSFFGRTEKQIKNYFNYLVFEDDHVFNLAYPTIVGFASNGAVLHYNESDRLIEENSLILMDAGCEYFNYASDITTTFSSDGIMTKKQKEIYKIVLRANKECKKMVKEGIDFKDIYFKCLEIIYDEMNQLNFFNNDYIEKTNLSKFDIAKILMPHGLGHFIGLDVHDVGGSLFKYKDENDSNGVILEENMVITIEPGIYFNKTLIDNHLILFSGKIKDYLPMGGIRIEDVIVVKKNGFEQLNDVKR